MIEIEWKQREWAKNQIKPVIAGINEILDERVNLDISVRIDLQHAIDTIYAAQNKLNQQPEMQEKNEE